MRKVTNDYLENDPVSLARLMEAELFIPLWVESVALVRSFVTQLRPLVHLNIGVTFAYEHHSQ